MKRTFALLTIFVCAFLTLSSCQQSKDKAETTESMDSTSQEQIAKVTYTCTMHPEVVSDKPGKCPKCGMDLVKKEGADEGMKQMDTTMQKN